MTDVVIVGGGAAGLVCARDLNRAGVEVTLVEASDGLGGRVRSDRVDGFTLDRGFQILLTAYPQVRQRLDVAALELGRFAPGALVRTDAGMVRLSDPLRRPQDLVASVRAPVGAVADRLRVAALVAEVCARPARSLLRRPDTSTAQRLRRFGFSAGFIDSFWRPFFAGIQLDPELEVSSKRFDIILRMLALGATGLPREGIGAVTAQLARDLTGPTGPVEVRLGAPVASVGPGEVELASGERLNARAVVVATDGPRAHGLLGARVPDPGSRPVAACWFSLPAPPVHAPFLLLDGVSGGPALNAVVISQVQPAYAPPGRALVVAAVPGPRALVPGLADEVAAQLSSWLDVAPGELELVRTDVIPHGQPSQSPPLNVRRRVDLGDGLFVCGDHRDTASLQGAMFSGERTARAVLGHLGGPERLAGA